MTLNTRNSWGRGESSRGYKGGIYRDVSHPFPKGLCVANSHLISGNTVLKTYTDVPRRVGNVCGIKDQAVKKYVARMVQHPRF